MDNNQSPSEDFKGARPRVSRNIIDVDDSDSSPGLVGRGHGRFLTPTMSSSDPPGTRAPVRVSEVPASSYGQSRFRSSTTLRRPNIQATAHQVPGIQPVDGASSLKAQMDDIVEGIDSLLLSPCRLPSETSSNKGSARSIAGSDETLSMTASELEAINDVTSGAGLGFLMDENRNTVDGAAALPLDPVTLFSRSLVSQQDTLESILRWIEDDAPYEGYTPFPDYLLMLLQLVVEENATCLDNVCTIKRAEGCKCPCTCKAAKKD